MIHRLGTILLIILAVLVMTACTADSGGEATDSPTAAATSAAMSPSESEAEESASEDDGGGDEARVRISGSAFDPQELTVAAGTEVTFVNADSFAHTVTHGTEGQAVDDPIVDEEIEQNGAVQVMFEEPGTYDITCGIHPSMQMTITVEG